MIVFNGRQTVTKSFHGSFRFGIKSLSPFPVPFFHQGIILTTMQFSKATILGPTIALHGWGTFCSTPTGNELDNRAVACHTGARSHPVGSGWIVSGPLATRSLWTVTRWRAPIGQMRRLRRQCKLGRMCLRCHPILPVSLGFSTVVMEKLFTCS